jgi:hypothetical protein
MGKRVRTSYRGESEFAIGDRPSLDSIFGSRPDCRAELDLRKFIEICRCV